MVTICNWYDTMIGGPTQSFEKGINTSPPSPDMQSEIYVY